MHGRRGQGRRMGCAGTPRPAGPQADVDRCRWGESRRSRGTRKQPTRTIECHLSKGVRLRLPTDARGCHDGACRAEDAPDRSRGNVARVARMASGDTVAMGTSRARTSATGTSAMGEGARQGRESQERALDEKPSTATGTGDDVSGERAFRGGARGRNILYAAILNT